MREHKFKVWDKTHEEWLEIGGDYFLTYSDGKLVVIQGDEHWAAELEDIEIVEYTGFKDKNCNEAYEGSLIPYNFNNKKIGVVKYGEYKNICDDQHASHVGFYVEWQDEELRSMLRKDLGFWLKVSSVVGHIYENPELLE
jgi:uncharacterized phage protein (TIGR01671 family)